MTKDKSGGMKAKVPWYFSGWLIILLILTGVITFGITSMIGIILLFGRLYYIKSENLKSQISEAANLQQEITSLKTELDTLDIKRKEIQNNISNSEVIFEEKHNT